MYEELVKRLRDYEQSGLGAISPYEAGNIADAIEELNLIAESNRRSMEAWAAESARAHDMMPRWIPVTERLPQPYEDVNLQFSTNQAVGFWDGYCWGVYSGDGFYTEVADNEGKPTHWCKKLPEPPKEEDNG